MDFEEPTKGKHSANSAKQMVHESEIERALSGLSKYADILPVLIPQPRKFRATLNDFLRIVVKARTPADSIARLRLFLCEKLKGPMRSNKLSQVEPENSAANFIALIKKGDQKGGFFAEMEWNALAEEYLRWWQDQKSQKAKEAARASVKIRKQGA